MEKFRKIRKNSPKRRIGEINQDLIPMNRFNNNNDSNQTIIMIGTKLAREK